MRKLVAFEQVTLDGYFADANSDIRWAHRGGDDAEWNAWVAENAQGGDTLLFGRITYEMMKSYWPTPAAKKDNPAVAEEMNRIRKVVFSRTLQNASWNNTTILNGDLAAEVRKLKQEPGKGITILGSGSIVSQLAQAGLIDEYEFVLNPVVLGKGRSLFEGLDKQLNLEMTRTRSFSNGNIVLWYAANR